MSISTASRSAIAALLGRFQRANQTLEAYRSGSATNVNPAGPYTPAQVDTAVQAAVDAAEAAGFNQLPSTEVVVANGGTVPVKTNAGAVVTNAVADVAAGAISGVRVPATVAVVPTGATNAQVANVTGALARSSTASVVNGALTLRLPGNAATVSHNATTPITGAFTGTASIQVVNGLITGVIAS